MAEKAGDAEQRPSVAKDAQRGVRALRGGDALREDILIQDYPILLLKRFQNLLRHAQRTGAADTDDGVIVLILGAERFARREIKLDGVAL